MKNRGLIALVGIALCACLAAPAQAKWSFEIKTVGGSGSTVEKTNFGLNETPWLYISFDNARPNWGTDLWTSPDGVDYLTFSDIANEKERWVSLSNWDSIKKSGEWEIFSTYTARQGQQILTNNGYTKFSVAPEPFSAGLFVLGGSLLALRRRRS